MRVLVLRFPLESAHGGAEVQTMTLLTGLRERGHEVAFLGSCPTLLRLCQAAGIRATSAHVGPPPVSAGLSISFAWRRRGMRRALLEALEHEPLPDVVLMLSLTEKLLLTEPLTTRGVRVVWVEHDRVGRWLRRNPWLPELRRLSRLATTVCVSPLSRQLYLDLGWQEQRTVAIANGIDLTQWLHVPEAQPKTTTLHVGCVARLTQDKGVDVLLDAVKHVPDAAISVVGAGREHDRIQRLIGDVHAQGREAILIAPPTDLARFYGDIDVLVLPSREHDPFGLVVAEAMAAGRPCVVTDVCGVASFIEHGVDGFVVPAGSASDLVEALEHLRDPALRLAMGRKARETARTRFAAATMIEAYELLLKN